uniref:Uncharacterized protein n=1 Tax=Clastoptera arizonana TaxID=38151 RepID=A0A1B6DBZ0_9HEMI
MLKITLTYLVVPILLIFAKRLGKEDVEILYRMNKLWFDAVEFTEKSGKKMSEKYAYTDEYSQLKPLIKMNNEFLSLLKKLWDRKGYKDEVLYTKLEETLWEIDGLKDYKKECMENRVDRMYLLLTTIQQVKEEIRHNHDLIWWFKIRRKESKQRKELYEYYESLKS